MSTLLVTSVGAIGSASYGWSSVVNWQTYASAQGYCATLWGKNYVLPDIPARNLVFDFTTYRFTLNLAFGWDGQLSVPQGCNSLRTGTPTLATDLYIEPVGFDATRYGRSFLSCTGTLLLAFTDSTQPSGAAFRFNFGLDSGLVVGVKGIFKEELGNPGVSIVQFVYASSWESLSTDRGFVLPFPYLLVLDFTERKHWEARFNFGGADPLLFVGFDATEFGRFSIITDTLVHGEGLDGTLYGRFFIANSLPMAFGFVGSQVVTRSNVVFAWGSKRAFTPEGFDLLQIPEFQIGGNLGYAAPFGWLSQRFGDFDSRLKDISISFSWSETAHFGGLNVYNALTGITFIGNPDQTQWGLPQLISVVPRFCYMESEDGLIFGKPTTSLWFRKLEVHYPYSGNFVGTAKVIYRFRPVYMDWFIPLAVGFPKIIRYLEVLTDGIQPLGCGIPDVAYSNCAFYSGHDSRSIGTFKLELLTKYIKVLQPLDYTDFTHTPVVYNALQRITLLDNPEHYSTYHFGHNTWIRLKNQPVNVDGLNSSAFPMQFEGVYNTGRAVVLDNPPDTNWGRLYCDFAIRPLQVFGWESRKQTSSNLVWNYALAAYPLGFTNPQFGQAKVWSNLQTVRMHTAPVPEYGTSFVAYRIRDIQVKKWEYQTSKFGTQYVGNFTQYLDFAGVIPPLLGELVFAGPFRRGFTPRWMMRDVVSSDFRVHNFNPQVWVPGRPYTEFSERHWLSHSPIRVVNEGISSFAVWKFSIRDRTQSIRPQGSYTWVCDRLFRVKNLGADPPSTRIVSVSEYTIPLYSVSIFRIRTNVLYLISKDSFTSGDSWIRIQGCLIKNQRDSLRMGIPKAITSQYLIFPKVSPDISHTVWGKFSTNIWTVWATHNTPQEAIRNHPGETFRDFGSGETCIWGRYPCWGISIVSLGRRYLPMRGSTQSSYGDFTVVLKTTRVTFTKSKSFLIIPSFTLYPHTQRVFTSGIHYTGVSSLIAQGATYPFTQYLTLGCNFSVIPKFNIELNIRHIKFNAGQKLTYWGNNDPMVHFRRGFTVRGSNLFISGTFCIEYKNRQFPIEGMDYLDMTFDYHQNIMRVKGGIFDATSSNTAITFFGPKQSKIGICSLSTTHTLRVFMISPLCITCPTVGYLL